MKKITQKAYKETKDLRLTIAKNQTGATTITFEPVAGRGSYNVTVYPNPTHNCQMFSIGAGYSLKHLVPGSAMADRVINLIMLSASGRSIGVFDIKDNHIDSFLAVMKTFAKSIHQHTYTSTNSSKMHLLQIFFEKHTPTTEHNKSNLIKTGLYRANKYTNVNAAIPPMGPQYAGAAKDQRTEEEEKESISYTYKRNIRQSYLYEISTATEIEVEKRYKKQEKQREALRLKNIERKKKGLSMLYNWG